MQDSTANSNHNQNKPILKIDPTIMKIVLLLVVLIVFVVIISIVIRSRSDDLDPSMYDEVSDLDLGEPSRVQYDNLTYLRKMVGGTLPPDFYVIMPKVVLDNSEGEQSTETYTIRIDNSSVETSVYFPYDICNFIFSVSDGRKYQAAFIINGEELGGLLVIPVDNGENIANLYLLNTGNIEEQNSEVSTISEWAKSIYSGDINIVTN